MAWPGKVRHRMREVALASRSRRDGSGNKLIEDLFERAYEGRPYNPHTAVRNLCAMNRELAREFKITVESTAQSVKVGTMFPTFTPGTIDARIAAAVDEAGGKIRRDALIPAAWPDPDNEPKDPEGAERALNTHLSEMNRRGGEEGRATIDTIYKHRVYPADAVRDEQGYRRKHPRRRLNRPST